MKNELNPTQSLLLWNMITGETPAAREPALSEAIPKLNVKRDRAPLLDAGYLTLESRGRAKHLLLTEKAWAWAASCSDVELPRDAGSRALQGLLRKLLPFLQKKRIALAALVVPQQPKKTRARRTTRKTNGASTSATEPKRRAKAGREPAKRAAAAPRASTPRDTSLTHRVEAACLELANGERKQRVRLSALRASLEDVSRVSLDRALLEMQDQGRAVLYRDDNTAALTAADHEAALIVGNAPRHLVYLET